jgi:hypothetical protein
MAESGAIRAGRAFVELFADGTALERGLNAAAGKLKAWGAGISHVGMKLGAIGAAISGPLIAAAVSAAHAGDRLEEMSARTGIGVQALSTLGMAASMTGSNLEEIERPIRQMQKTITGMKDDAEGTAGSLAHLGIAAAEIKGLPVDEQFARIGAAVAAIGDPTERAAAAMKVFGRSGTMLLPMLAEFDKLRAQVAPYAITPEEAASAHAYSKSLTLVGLALGKVKMAIGSALFPVLKEMSGWMLTAGRDAGAWIGQNQGLIVTVLKIGLAAVVAGPALIVLGKGISLVGSGLKIVLGVAPFVVGLFKTLAVIVTGLLSPFALITAAIVGLALSFDGSRTAIGGSIDWLKDRFGDLKAFACESFAGIAGALASGDLALAADVLWKSLAAAWTTGVATLTKIWTDGIFAMQSMWIKFASLTVEAAEKVWHGGKTAAIKAGGTAELVATAVQRGPNLIIAKLMGRDDLYNQQMGLVVQEARRTIKNTEYALSEERGLHTKTLELIYEDANKQLSETEKLANAKVNAAKVAAAAALAAWNAAVATGKAKGLAAATTQPAGPGEPTVPSVESLRAAVSAVRGIFNPMALLSLKGGSGGDPLKDAAAAAITTRDLTRKLVDNTNRLVALAEKTNVFA